MVFGILVHALWMSETMVNDREECIQKKELKYEYKDHG